MLNHRNNLTECSKSPQTPYIGRTHETPAVAVRARPEVIWEHFKESQRTEQVTDASGEEGRTHRQ